MEYQTDGINSVNEYLNEVHEILIKAVREDKAQAYTKVIKRLANLAKKDKDQYFQKIHDEMIYIRNYMPLLEKRADKYTNIFVFAKYLFNSEKLSKVKSLKDKLSSLDDCFDEKYELLRKIYEARLNHFTDDELIEEYEKITLRREDWKKRLEEVNGIKERNGNRNNKRIKKLSGDITEEIERRDRARKDALVEIYRRKIDLEKYYMN